MNVWMLSREPLRSPRSSSAPFDGVAVLRSHGEPCDERTSTFGCSVMTPQQYRSLATDARQAADWDANMEYEGGRSRLLYELAAALEDAALCMNVPTEEES